MQQTKVYVITGGTGGMGIATAKRFAKKGKLLLADISTERLEAVQKELESAGANVKSMVCDITSQEQVQRMANLASKLGVFGAIIHTAGLSPALADADNIMAVNALGTANVLDSFIGLAEKDSVALCVSSMSGYLVPANDNIDELLDQPQEKNFLSDMNAIIKGDRGLSYAYSKRGVIRMVEKQAGAWGKKGARIVSISPGLINTPMGKKEAETPSVEAQMKQLNPLRRFGEPDEVAALIEFLCSTDASYINGCDVRIDGGSTPIMQGKAAPE